MLSVHAEYPEHPVACGNDAANLSVLLAVLARIFSYPSIAEAADLVKKESATYCSELLSLIGIDSAVCSIPPDFFQASEGERCHPGGPDNDVSLLSAAQELRSEMSRLFYVPFCPIRLEGRYWISRESRSNRSARMGERAGVAWEYALHGVRLRKCRSTAEDSLENELDFMSHLACREAIALSNGDAANALHWKEARRHFYAMHMNGFVAGVTTRILEESHNPFLQYYAHVLSMASGRMAE